jgi:hypothetical protein
MLKMGSAGLLLIPIFFLGDDSVRSSRVDSPSQLGHE